MFDPIFTLFGPVGSALALLLIVLPVLAIAAFDTLRLVRPGLSARFTGFSGGLGRVRASLLQEGRRVRPRGIAYARERGDSLSRDASGRSLRGAALRFQSVFGGVGPGAPTQRRTR